MNKDPVCGMVVIPGADKHRTDHEGVTFHFCCSGCKAKFLADPARYLPGAAAAESVTGPPIAAEPSAVSVRVGLVYTCPMHPRIRQTAPGSCPLCGMALEPDGIPAEGANPNSRT